MRAGGHARVYLGLVAGRAAEEWGRAVGGGLGAAKGLPMAAAPKSRRARAAVLAFPGPSRLRGFSLPPPGAGEPPLCAWRTVQIDGAPPRVAEHVEQALEPFRGRSLLALNQGKIEQRLAGLSDVAAVSFDRDFPHTLRVFVTPAHSIA